ncbi:MAG: glycosyltransferase [Prevotellaceae bacterium]|jgi:glycosyltransferase involved in cell wall biosynthesis|nr:glycosyltransferase [Prevotellaceae bacterium]
MKDKKLTLIIPFLNERYEVENTIKSIIVHSFGDIEILLINDASDDGFDYKVVAEKYNVSYIENMERLGVAASRDLGVEWCRTPYFLFLDAHMRFYDNLWVQRIVEELTADKRALLCCQTKSLGLENGLLVERANRSTSYGACVELSNKKRELVEPYWIFGTPFDTTELQTFPIVCVLGAGYACSKEYWQYLKGLEGLKYYGTDESYISMKVWMEGGTCKLLKDVVIGHIYRTNRPPYSTEMKFRLYNRLFIAELLLPKELKKELLSMIKLFHFPYLSETLLMLYENDDKIRQLKHYYKNIFTRDFLFFEEMNTKYHNKNKTKDRLADNINAILDSIVKRIEEQTVPEIGILRGRMGIVIFLFYYAGFTDSEPIAAETMLADLLKDIKADTHYGFYTGLSGIGWGIEYLHQQGFVEGDTNEILADFDKKIMEINPQYICNLNKDYGFGGIVLYLLVRLYTIEKEAKANPFDREYLTSVYDRICSVVAQRDTSCDSIDIFLAFLNYYENKETIAQAEIYDVWCLLNPQNTFLQDLDLGLQGATGVGLKLILDHTKQILFT